MWLRVSGLGLTVTAAIAMACGSSVPPSLATPSPAPTSAPTDRASQGFPLAFFIENRGGPALTVRINGAARSVVSCNAAERIAPAEDDAPPLPWHLTLDPATGGAPVFSQMVTVLPYWLVQIGEETVTSDEPILGPPGPTCGREISQEEAIEEARQHTSLQTLVSVAAGRFAELNSNPRIGPGYDIKRDELVWAVTFSGDMEICSPQPGDCVTRPGTATVILDFATGAWRATQANSPS